jgi:mycothiol synthase
MISRPYRTLTDLEAIIQLIVDVRPTQWISDYPGVRDLRELLSLPEMQAATHLWESKPGNLTGFALVDSVNTLLFELDPATSTPEIEDQVVAWGMSQITHGYKGAREHPALDATCRAENTPRKAFLERHGFVRVKGESVSMTRSLIEPIPRPVLPSGFSIRPVAGEQEIDAYVALHQAAFGTKNMTTDYRGAIMRSKEYIPELDLVAEAPDGTLAALCVCQISSVDNRHAGRLQGLTDPVATHPSYRRLGLSKALLLTGLSLLKDRGMETARLVTNGDNIPMMCAASEAGFTISSAIYWYTKTPE